MNKGFITSALGALLFFSVATQVQASSGTVYGSSDCQIAYGGNQCENINLLLDKKIADPTTVDKKGQSPSNYQDNWGVNAAKYVPGQHVPYQITVTNTGTKTLTDISVKDTLPSYINYVSGGKFDSKTKIVTITIDKLGAGDSKNLDIIGQVVSSNELPSDQTTVCDVVNKAVASTDSLSSQDTAELCIQKEAVGGGETKGGLKVFPAPKTKTTPPTGSEALALIGLLPGGILGMFLRKKSQS